MLDKLGYRNPKYEIIIAFPRQQWLREHASMLRQTYRGADKSLAWATSRCILFDGENISFDASLVIYIYIYIYIYIFLQLCL